MNMNEEVMGGAEAVMQNGTWKFAINYLSEIDDGSSTSEAVCNGIWTEILRRHFPYPDFIIAPEQRQTTGVRPDLTIFAVFGKEKLAEWEPIFTFEGKAPKYEKSMVADGKAQAANYLPDLAWSKERKNMKYGMLACGKSFMILKYDANKKELYRIDPSNQEDSMMFEASSLTDKAAGFDKFCRDFVTLFY
ncbi:uncharacterized protein FSUBG_11924 [Fusarium subglutinans]|uniref:Uncharacterized protein n=1 Tax=Gibberella subglutinans TaxID=42677 RepID=A0A8H5L5Y1_GIBSU|nr:uncharacterized protein FSUBG_11924 [Fusarium subglutinans]KAF5586994.1 hypothetical protein FSUBG_11924 [Fusarium subglutinans]